MGCLRFLDIRLIIKDRILRVIISIYLLGRRGKYSYIYKGYNVYGVNIFDNRIIIFLDI